MRHFPGLCSRRTEKMIADSGKKGWPRRFQLKSDGQTDIEVLNFKGTLTTLQNIFA